MKVAGALTEIIGQLQASALEQSSNVIFSTFMYLL